MADAYGTDCIFTAHGFPTQARVQQMRTSVPWQLQDTALQVSRSVSVHGLCATHRSRKPPGHRDLLAGDAAQAVSCRAFDTRFPGAPWPMPTRTGTGASTPTSLRCSLATPASYTAKTTSELQLRRDCVCLRIPAPSILCLSLFPWARFRQRKAAIKLHTLMDLRGNIPCFIRITEGKTHDVGLLDELILEPGAFYIMDRGYIDFARLYTFTQQAAFFVIRAKRNLGLYSAYVAPGRQKHRLAQRPDHRTARTQDLTRLPRCPGAASATSTSRRRSRFVFLTNHFRPSRLDHPAVVQMPLAGGVVLQVDQTNICKSKRSSAPPRTRSRPRSGSLSALTCSWPSSRSSYTSTAVWPKSCKSSPFPYSEKVDILQLLTRVNAQYQSEHRCNQLTLFHL